MPTLPLPYLLTYYYSLRSSDPHRVCWPTVHKEITFRQHRSLVFVEPILFTTEEKSGRDWILTLCTTGGLTLQDVDRKMYPVLGTAKHWSVIPLHPSCLMKAKAGSYYCSLIVV